MLIFLCVQHVFRRTSWTCRLIGQAAVSYTYCLYRHRAISLPAYSLPEGVSAGHRRSTERQSWPSLCTTRGDDCHSETPVWGEQSCGKHYNMLVSLHYCFIVIITITVLLFCNYIHYMHCYYVILYGSPSIDKTRSCGCIDDFTHAHTRTHPPSPRVSISCWLCSSAAWCYGGLIIAILQLPWNTGVSQRNICVCSLVASRHHTLYLGITKRENIHVNDRNSG